MLARGRLPRRWVHPAILVGVELHYFLLGFAVAVVGLGCSLAPQQHPPDPQEAPAARSHSPKFPSTRAAIE